MKNKIGYTLIELIALIIILGIIFTIASVFIVKNFDDGKQAAYDTEIKYILNRATDYGNSILEEVKDAKSGITITVGKLKDKGFLTPNDDGKIADPRNEKKSLEELQIRITYNSDTNKAQAEMVK